MLSRTKVLSLYKSMIKESNKFSSYNFREYAKKRIKHEFEANKQLNDQAKQAELIQKANANLNMIKRQVLVSQLYPTEKLIIE
ncbi:unnamed protein product [Brachionus calyciflorus]|uniref:Complex 1 LYR protein domain-containing protein n=1 Tax=Brachionus calyciflorus TaxID=104777 RepID=A0A813MC79_9BILA|nr:unnamed protein product [Brachionus calyciflorus]